MKEHFRIHANPVANIHNMIRGEKYRITLLTEKLVRLEYSENGKFEDRPTQMVWNRNFPKVDYIVNETEEELRIRTSALQIVYDKKKFSGHGLYISVTGTRGDTGAWHYGDPVDDLKGTARTLDRVDGDQITLESGILSWHGFSVLDDSKSVVISEDGWIEAREPGTEDIYFWGYGHEYKQALKDFYYLCGNTPMLPRFALGNWWSRYYRYSEKSYLELMDRFQEKGIPFSVAVIDMDWHLVDIPKKYGHGWTGFTWNRELFPEPEKFMEKLHERNMKVTLNLHPADGIRAHEERYPVIAEHMGVDQASEEPVRFDAADPQFLQYYYEDILHTLEEEGVDFWWMDWQQGVHTKIENLDPLWLLNHYNFLDSGRKGKRPFTFSRYCGVGSHRYPIGFSGDSIVTWETLRFQPYFTANASNVGYGWWSHDIGGHMLGYKDNELMTRWVQYAVFSPILRLHSSNSKFTGKEPWRYGEEAEKLITEAMRFRHRLIPYIYTMNYRNYKEGEPLIRPIYYENPDKQIAYRYKNEYYFGESLLVMPITSKRFPGINQAKEKMWLPEGIWYDIFNHRVYRGAKEMYVYRDLKSIPVFAKAGTILPLTDRIDQESCAKNPSQLHICLYMGGQSEFELYEDDNESTEYQNGNCVKTLMKFCGSEDNATTFEICPSTGNLELIPEKRDYVLEFIGAYDMTGQYRIMADGREVPASDLYDAGKHRFTVTIQNIPTNAKVSFESRICGVCQKNEIEEEIIALVDQAEIDFALKDSIDRMLRESSGKEQLLAQLYAEEKMDQELFGALMEILTAE